MNGKKIDNVKKIAVLRANGLGDFIFSLPALEALRSAYPQAEIVLLGLPWHATFLSSRPSPIDRVIPIPPVKGIREIEGAEEEEEIERFLQTMQDEQFDISVQIHGGGRYSNPFLLRTGARLTVGLRTVDARELDRWVPYVYFQPEILRYLEVVGLVGATVKTLQPKLSVTRSDIDESLNVVSMTEDRIVALAPGAGDGRRRWPPEKFAAVGDRLAQLGARIVLTGVGAERNLIDGVISRMRFAAESLCGRLSIGGLSGLLSRCDLVVANDSGSLHLASALGTPVVGVYWCGNLITAEPVERTLHRPLLSWRLECPTCGTNCIYSKCDHHDSFVADVSVNEVLVEAEALFQRSVLFTR